jgi:orotidine-5'-phosphate decarboxylase
MSWLCLGLDPDLDRLPTAMPRTVVGVIDFCRAIVEATSDLVTAYKVNFAFFEALGPAGWEALARVRSDIPDGIPVIADAKRADIANTDRFYAEAIFGQLDFDAVTVNPYLGWDSLAPFFDRPGKGVLVLCRTSNPGASQLQDLEVNGEPLYLRVAREALQQPSNGSVGLVLGAAHPRSIERVRNLSSQAVLLLVGVGAQGGTVGDALNVGASEHGQNALVGVSREILYASSDATFAKAARTAAEHYAQQAWLEGRHAGTDR